jgi:hypothetical protein
MKAPMARSWLQSTVGRPRCVAFVMSSEWVSKGLQNLYSSVRLRSAPPTFFHNFPYVFRFLAGVFKSPATTRTALVETAPSRVELAHSWLSGFSGAHR